MVKNILSKRAIITFVLAVLAFTLLTIRILWHPFSDSQLPDFSLDTIFYSRNESTIETIEIRETRKPIITRNHLTRIHPTLFHNSTILTSTLTSRNQNNSFLPTLPVQNTTIPLVKQVSVISSLRKHNIENPINSINSITPIRNNISLANITIIDSISLQRANILDYRRKVRKGFMPLTSPSEGTDILSNPKKLLLKQNQSRAIVPKLDLQRDFTVYLCKHKDNGVRFFFLSREGLLLHPRIHLVENPAKAEFIVYLPVSSPWDETECNNSSYRNKTIVLDEGDGPGLFVTGDKVGPWFLYFKRSFVSRHKGIFQGYMQYINHGEVFPMTYSTGEAYIKFKYTPMSYRSLDILCTLRGSNHDPVRLRVREWVEEYIKARGIKNAIAGQINHESRRTISKAYFENMYNARIIVTSNPSGWEGDFRFCEALSSGALIFIDHMYVPRPYPFIDKQHIILYDNNNKTDLLEKLDYYLARNGEIEIIAMQGYLHAMKYHRAMNLIDYVFKTVHTKLLNATTKSASNLRGSNQVGLYTQTGYDILKIAQMNSKKYKIHHHG